LAFKVLPGFAQFLLDKHLDSFTRELIRLSKQVNIPLLKYLSNLSEQELFEFSKTNNTSWLQCFAQNRVGELIDTSQKQWIANQLPQIDRTQIIAQDLTLLAYIRKQSLLTFLPDYAATPQQIIDLVREIDEYILAESTRSTQTFINLLNEQINDQLHFNERLAATSPGVVYVFDLIAYKEVYTNRTIGHVLGYSQAELDEYGSSFPEVIRHPDDSELYSAHFRDFRFVPDGEIRTIEHRLKGKDGRYRWMRSYESVFKRNAAGIPTQVIGISLDIDAEKRNAEELQKREALLLEAQTLARLGSFDWDVETLLAEVTPQVLTILELQPGDQLSGFLKQVHSADRGRVQTAISHAIKTNSELDIEYRYQSKTNEKIIWSRGNVVKENGRTLLKGTVMDVTDRHQMLQQLQQSEELYKQSQALTHIGNWSWDIPTDVLNWSDEMYRIYGLTPQVDTISFDRFIQALHPDDREMALAHIQASLATGQPNEFDHRIMLPTGQVRILHAIGTVLVDETGQPYKMVGTGQDVTDQRLAEKQLQEKQAFIQKITDTTPALIASYNINTGNYQFVSEGITKLLGYSTEVALTQGAQFFMSLIHPDDLVQLAESNSKALETQNQPHSNDNEIVEFRYRMRHKNGDYRWFQTYGTVFDRDAKGNIEQILNISLDITDQIDAERLIADYTRQLEQSNASLKEFAYIASHDLKEPLRKISTIGDRLLLTQRERMDQEGQFFLERMVQSASRMQVMINDILSVSQISGTKAYKLFSLQAILDDVLSTIALQVEQAQASITSDPLPQAHIIPAQFRQLFLNLLTNSLKFKKTDVQLQIHIGYRQLNEVDKTLYSLPPAAYYHELLFCDNGIGFENRFADRIFAFFQRLHGQNQYEGTGMGLAICKRIVENHNGIITATGVPNQGATFRVIFPS
jgi:PAS domain S-box-containing protein